MAIQSLSELRVFQAGHTIIENDDLKYLGCLQSLYKIQVDGTAISDESIAHVSRMANLQELFIRDTRITAIGLNSLLKLRKLRKLDLSGCRKLSEAEVEEFQRARPDCTVFREQSLRWDSDDKGAVEDLL